MFFSTAVCSHTFSPPLSPSIGILRWTPQKCTLAGLNLREMRWSILSGSQNFQEVCSTRLENKKQSKGRQTDLQAMSCSELVWRGLCCLCLWRQSSLTQRNPGIIAPETSCCYYRHCHQKKFLALLQWYQWLLIHCLGQVTLFVKAWVKHLNPNAGKTRKVS